MAARKAILPAILKSCDPAMAAKWDDMAVVGRIARPHGLRGHVVVNLETDFPEERFRPGAELFVERRGVVEPLTLASVRFQNQRPVIEIAGIATIDEAERLAGLELRVPADRLASLPQGTFYRHDLVGCLVETRDGARVGVVREVEGTLAGSRLVVAASHGDVLIPLASEICTTIDVAAKRIVIEPPEGLLDLNR
jgi:16S rRNA processing protein RimM